ncbi:hypothetical protein AAC387_Pa01g2177 [Persea americana]
MAALNSESPTQPLEAIVTELGTIIMYDPSGNSEPVHQMFLYEIDKVGRLYFTKRDGFGPFAKVVSGDEYESVTLTRRWGDGPDDVNPPHIEMPRGDGRV